MRLFSSEQKKQNAAGWLLSNDKLPISDYQFSILLMTLAFVRRLRILGGNAV